MLHLEVGERMSAGCMVVLHARKLFSAFAEEEGAFMGFTGENLVVGDVVSPTDTHGSVWMKCKCDECIFTKLLELEPQHT